MYVYTSGVIHTTALMTTRRNCVLLEQAHLLMIACSRDLLGCVESIKKLNPSSIHSWPTLQGIYMRVTLHSLSHCLSIIYVYLITVRCAAYNSEGGCVLGDTKQTVYVLAVHIHTYLIRQAVHKYVHKWKGNNTYYQLQSSRAYTRTAQVLLLPSERVRKFGACLSDTIESATPPSYKSVQDDIITFYTTFTFNPLDTTTFCSHRIGQSDNRALRDYYSHYTATAYISYKQQ